MIEFLRQDYQGQCVSAFFVFHIFCRCYQSLRGETGPHFQEAHDVFRGLVLRHSYRRFLHIQGIRPLGYDRSDFRRRICCGQRQQRTYRNTRTDQNHRGQCRSALRAVYIRRKKWVLSIPARSMIIAARQAVGSRSAQVSGSAAAMSSDNPYHGMHIQ